jgi:glycosyltransferase involved in cell wall biosynthesis
MPSISVVIPVYNSEHSLAELYARLVRVLESLQCDFEIILVDDCSQDNSLEIIRSLRKQDPRVEMIQLACNHGQHLATLCGMQYSRGALIITMDDDLQQLPEEIPLLLAKIESGGYDVVFAVPARKKQAFYRNLGSHLMQSSLTLLFSKPRDIESSSYRVLTRPLAESMLNNQPRFVYFSALIFQYTNNSGNVTVKHEKRKYGSSNYTLASALRLALNLYLNYAFAKPQSSRPFHFDIACLEVNGGN